MTEAAAINNVTCVASWGNHGLAAGPDRRLLPVHYRRSVGRPLCGDVVDIQQQTDNEWLVSHIHPRRNCFARGDRYGKQQQIAANIEQAMVVLAPEPAPSRDLIDRYLVAGELLDFSITLVLNKTDLPDQTVSEQRERLALYADLDYPVLETSAETGTGIGALADQLTGKCSMLVGQSGVGKSSLLNRLIPDLALQTNTLSTASGKGKHTTTIAQLYYFDARDARMIDSPGVWEYGLWSMSSDELARGFREFQPWLGQCKFNDCRHTGEPGCALQAQADDNPALLERLTTYRRLLDEQQRFPDDSDNGRG